MHLTRRRHASRPLIATLVVLLLTALIGAVPSPASAAGSGALDVAITPVDVSDGSTITEIADGQHDNRVTYEVQYGCTSSACDNAQVQLSPSQPDPYGLLPDGRFLLLYEDWTAPVGGGTISGDNTTGKQVSLGNLAAGASGSFKVTYRIERTFSSPGNDSGDDIPNGSFYPDGFELQMAATISSDTAVAPVVENASDVTWHIGVPNGPSTGIGSPTSIEPGEDVVQRLVMNGGNMHAGSGANVTGRADVNAVGNYTVVYTAPSEATIVEPAPYGGVINHANNTITWTMGTEANPVYGARGGWGLNQTSGFNSSGPAQRNGTDPTTQAFWIPRDVTLHFDGSAFPDADVNGCNFSAEVTSTIDVSVTYLDADRTTKAASNVKTADVACWDPFGSMLVEKNLPASQTTRLDGAIENGPPPVSALNVPGPGAPDRVGPSWQVRVSNRGNVPGVATIDEPNLVHDHIKVDRIQPTNVGMNIEWTADDGSGNLTSGTDYRAANANLNAPTGGWFVSAHATTDPIDPGRIQPTDTTESWANLSFFFRTSSGAPLGERRLNTADVELTYPGFGGGDGEPTIYQPWTDVSDREPLTQPLTATVSHIAQYTRASPGLTAQFTGAPVVEGGGNPAPGAEVSYTMRAQTQSVWPGTQIIPQLAFVAPAGWEIVPGSAEMAADAPEGVTFEYVTKTIGGQDRQVVLATWPSSITPDPLANENWPTLTVKAVAGPNAPTGNGAAVANVWAGDDSGSWADAVGTRYITDTDQFRAAGGAADASDIDGDFNIGEPFATAASSALTVTAASLLTVVKEICVPDAGEVDGCIWEAGSAAAHYVPVDSDDVKYRITIRNAGNTTVSGAVAYDVLPHAGDTGLLTNPIARGSEFDMAIESVESAPAGTTLAYSASTNPARPEVNPGASGTVDDWGSGAAGKKAVRISVDDSLAPGDAKTVVLVASVAEGALADQIACNSVAIDSAQSLPAEPPAVCVTLAEADLEIALGDVSDLYPGTTRTLDYTVTNHGRSANAPGTATVAMPDGITVTDLDVDGWSCEVAGGGVAPVAGEASLQCEPVDADGDPRELALDEADELSLPIDVSSDITGAEVCFPASVTGPMFDPVLSNNLTMGCRALAAPEMPVLSVEKSYELTTDEVTPDEADEDDVITYSFKVTNDGPGTAHDVSIDDDLSGLSAVSPASVSTLAAGDSATFTATYTVTDDDVESGVVENSATATFTPPTPPGGTTPPEETTPPSNLVEVPTVLATPQLDVSKSVDVGSGTQVAAGDELTYTLTFDNTGFVPAPVDHVDHLDGILDDADVELVSQGGLTVAEDGDTYEISGSVPAGQTYTVTYTATVKAHADQGDHVLGNFLTEAGDDVPTTCASDSELCTTNDVPHLVASKTSDVSGSVEAGDQITYTLSFANDGAGTVSLDHVDHLAGVLDDADLLDDMDVTGGLSASVVDGELAVTGDLAADESGTVMYSAEVKPFADQGDHVLDNFLTETGDDVPSTCADDSDLCTEHRVRHLVVTKSVDPESGAQVAKGDELSYTLTFTNDGTADVEVDHTDDLSGVLDDANVIVDPSAEEGLLDLDQDGTDIGISGTLEPDETETVTYAVQVLPRDERGDDTLTNFLLADGQEPPTNGACDPEGEIACTANPVEGEIEVVKSVDADGPVSGGDTLTYTLEIANTGVHSGRVDQVDHLAEVLDDATFGRIVSDGGLDVARDGDLMRVTGQLEGGDSTEVVYTVKARSSAKDGDGVILNAVAANGVSVDLDSCSAQDAQCTSTKVRPAALLPDTGSPMGLGGLILGLVFLLAGTVLVSGSRRRHGGARRAG
jgi:uncharacterized repeat protein (TIGR01451 family)